MQDSYNNVFLPNRGTMLISGLKDAESNVTSFIIPTKRIGWIPQPTALLELKHPSSQGEFSTFTVSFNLESDLKNYLQISDWLDNNMQYDDRGMYDADKVYRDITLLLYGSDNNEIGKITLDKAFPLSLSEIEISFGEMMPEPRIVTVDFEYQTFKIEIYPTS